MWTWTDLVPESLPGTPGLWGEAAARGAQAAEAVPSSRGTPSAVFWGLTRPTCPSDTVDGSLVSIVNSSLLSGRWHLELAT